MRVECWRVRLPQNPAKHPILIRPFNFQFLEFPPLKFRSYQADRQMPTWIVRGLDGNPVLVFPIFIAVCTVPSLQPFQVVRIHIISLPASTQLLINAVTGELELAVNFARLNLQFVLNSEQETEHANWNGFCSLRLTAV